MLCQECCAVLPSHHVSRLHSCHVATAGHVQSSYHLACLRPSSHGYSQIMEICKVTEEFGVIAN